MSEAPPQRDDGPKAWKPWWQSGSKLVTEGVFRMSEGRARRARQFGHRQRIPEGLEDLRGQRFGDFEVIAYSHVGCRPCSNKAIRHWWLCECRCGFFTARAHGAIGQWDEEADCGFCAKKGKTAETDGSS